MASSAVSVVFASSPGQCWPLIEHDELDSTNFTLASIHRLRVGDLAISGEGFFTLSDRGVVSYTRAIDLFDLGRYFPVLVTADDTQTHKPDPEPVYLGASLLGVEPARAAKWAEIDIRERVAANLRTREEVAMAPD